MGSDTTQHIDEVREALKAAAATAAEDAEGLKHLEALIVVSISMLQAIKDGGPSKATLDKFRAVLNSARQWVPYHEYPDPE